MAERSDPIGKSPELPTKTDGAEPSRGGKHGTAAWSPIYPLENRFVYFLISERAGGATVGINVNPDGNCNFSCAYCDVNRTSDAEVLELEVEVMARELKETLAFVRGGRLRELPHYRYLPDQLLRLRHVALSGDGEPTLSPKFAEALQAVLHVRAWGGFAFFKIVLQTNATGLDLPQVQQALQQFMGRDEVWAKLDGGTQAYLNRVNRADVQLEKILSNILTLGRQRPVVIQSLFPAINGAEPSVEEIDQYAQRLLELKEAGAEISLVQVFSAKRPTTNPEIGHLPLKALSQIAQTVHRVTGLKAEVF